MLPPIRESTLVNSIMRASMDVVLTATQVTSFCSSSLCHAKLQTKNSSKALSKQALGFTKLPGNANRLVTAGTWFPNPTVFQRSFFSVCAATEDSDLEPTDVELEETTPLEAFFNRYSSFLETFDAKKLRRIISAGSLDGDNRSPSILVMLGSEAFVKQLCDEHPDGYVETYHFSLNVLSDIKEQHDDTRCFHIETADLTQITGSFDAIFLNYFPAFSKSFPKLLQEVTRLCKPGGMVVISLAHDKRNLASLKVQSGGLLQCELPNKDTFVKMLSSLPLELVIFEDLPSLYIASLKFIGSHDRRKKANVKHSISSREYGEYPLYVKGDVVHGVGRGSKKLGFPTANLSIGSLPTKVSRLPKGVYFGCAQVISKGVDSSLHRMVMNIGNRPTFDEDDILTLEIHILHDFGTDFYGKELRIAIMGFIREEMKFPSIDELIKRIHKDVEVMQERLSDADFYHQKGVSFFVQS